MPLASRYDDKAIQKPKRLTSRYDDTQAQPKPLISRYDKEVAPTAKVEPEPTVTGESYPAIIGKSFAREALTAAPRAALTADIIKERAIEAVEKAARPLSPRPAGTPEERARAISEMTGKPYVPPAKPQEKYEGRIRPFLEEKVAGIEKALTPEVGDSRIKQIVSQAAGSLGRMVGTGFNLKVLAATAAFEKTGESLKGGADLPTAGVAGTVSGLTEYFTEKIPFAVLKSGAPFLKRLVKGIAADAPGEVIATLVEMGVVDENILNKNYTWADYKRAVEDTLAVSGLTTFGATTITSPFTPPRVAQPEQAPPAQPAQEIAPEQAPPITEITQTQAVRPETIDGAPSIKRKLTGPIDVKKELKELATKEVAPIKLRKGQSAVKLSPSRIESLKEIRAEVEAGQAGKRVFAEDKVTGEVSTFPEYFKDKGLKKKEVLNWIDRTLEGEGTTERMQAVVNDLIEGKRAPIARDIIETRGKPVTVDAIDLNVDDTYKIQGEQFKVKEVLDNGNIVVQDGVRKVLDPDDTVKIDRGTLQREGLPPIEGREGFPTAAESVVSGTLPINREGERGAITIHPPAPAGAATKEVSGVRNFVNSFKEFWSPLSTIPQSEEYLSNRYRSLGKLYQVETIVGKIKDKTKNLTPESKYEIFRFLNAEIPAESLTDKQRVMGKQIQNVFNISGKMAVKRGIIAQDTYDKHKNQYVPYLYLRHILDDDSTVGISPSGRLDLSYQKARKELTKEQQRSIGLIEDVSVAAPVGIGRILSDVVKYDRYADIADNPNWTFAPSRVTVDGKKIGIGELVEEVKIAEKMNRQAPNVPEIKTRLDTLKNALKSAQEASKNIPANFVKIPTSKKWGELSGAFVRKEIARDLLPESRETGKNSLSRIVRYALDFDAKAMAAFKVSKTALNPPTMFRNAVSNVMQQDMGGISIYKQPKNMLKTALAMKKNSQHYVEFKRNGGLKTNWSIVEINEVFDAVKTMQKQNNVIAGLKKMASLYGKIDDFFKLNMYIYKRGQGNTVEQSMLEAQKWTMDYTRVHPGIKVARKHIMPFVSYQYKIAPLIAETMTKRPWAILKYAAIPAAMTAIAKQRLNLSDKEFEEAKNELPTFLKNTGAYAPLLWRSKEGNLQWVNLEYYFPWSGIVNIGRDIKEGAYGELAGDLGVGSPVIDILTVLKTTKGDTPPKDPFSGRLIYNQLDSPTDKALKLGEWVYNKWAPTILTRYGTFGKAARIGEKDRYGREVTAGQAGASLFGANIIAPTQQQGSAERYVKTKELRLSLSRILRDPTKSEEEKRNAQAEYEKRVQEILNVQ